MTKPFTIAITSTSRAGQLMQSAVKALHDRIEARRAMAQIHQMDDHMLRQFGLNRIALNAAVLS